MDTDIVVRNAYRPGEGTVDIAVADGEITAVGTVDATGDRELDAGGALVSPGLVDAHVHLDMAFSAGSDRRPRYNERAATRDESIARSATYFAETPPEEVEANVLAAARLALANGVVHVRTHSYVDSTVGARVVAAVERARDRLEGLLDIQTVSFPQRGLRRDPGSLDALRAGLDAGADLVGGLDPATLNGDREGTIATWFDVAAEYDVGVDVHIHERGPDGLQTLARLAREAAERGHEGRVTASHAFALADAGDDDLDDLLPALGAADCRVLTCYGSTPPGMPLARLGDAGVTVGHGTDQIRTLWSPHGNADALEAMLVESMTLGYGTNDELAALWRLVTTGGARVLGREATYGIEPGTPADLVVHDARSPQWAVLTAATPQYVVSSGRVVAEDGAVVVDVPGAP